MQRRQALEYITVLLGSTLSAPTLLAMTQRESTPLSGTRFPFTDSQQQIIALVANHIIPRTDTPGAVDVGVPAFVQMMLQDCYLQPDQLSFQEGVQQLEKAGFASLTAKQQIDALKKLEAETKELMKSYNVQQSKMGDNEDKELMTKQVKGLPFWRLMKELTLIGYFTSEAGLKASFDYVPIPGRLAVMKYEPGRKTYAY